MFDNVTTTSIIKSAPEKKKANISSFFLPSWWEPTDASATATCSNAMTNNFLHISYSATPNYSTKLPVGIMIWEMRGRDKNEFPNNISLFSFKFDFFAQCFSRLLSSFQHLVSNHCITWLDHFDSTNRIPARVFSKTISSQARNHPRIVDVLSVSFKNVLMWISPTFSSSLLVIVFTPIRNWFNFRSFLLPLPSQWIIFCLILQYAVQSLNWFHLVYCFADAPFAGLQLTPSYNSKLQFWPRLNKFTFLMQIGSLRRLDHCPLPFIPFCSITVRSFLVLARVVIYLIRKNLFIKTTHSFLFFFPLAFHSSIAPFHELRRLSIPTQQRSCCRLPSPGTTNPTTSTRATTNP